MLIRLKTLSERQFASANTAIFDPWTGDRWQWIAEQVAEEFGCRPSDVETLDTDDELDLITVRGVPAARIVYDYGWRALVAA